MSKTRINKLVDRFLAWPLPASVCSDSCATKQGYPHRSGTTLLTAVEAKQMIEYLLAALPPAMEHAAMKQELVQLQAANYMWMTTHKELEANYNAVCAMLDPLRQRSEQLDALTLRWNRDTPTKPGWYWWRAKNVRPKVVEIFLHGSRLHINGDALNQFAGDWAGPIAPPEEA